MKILNIKKAIPMHSALIVTSDRYTEDESTHNGILDTTKLNQVKDIQTVVSPSEMVAARGIKEGDVLLIDFKKYAKYKQKKNSVKETMDEHYDNILSFEIPTILLDGREHLLIDMNDIALKVSDYEYVNEGEGLLSGEQVILN